MINIKIKIINKKKILFMKGEKKINFYFPSSILKSEDFSPVDISVLKDYYRNTFLQLIDKVRKILNNFKINR